MDYAAKRITEYTLTLVPTNVGQQRHTPYQLLCHQANLLHTPLNAIIFHLSRNCGLNTIVISNFGFTANYLPLRGLPFFCGAKVICILLFLSSKEDKNIYNLSRLLEKCLKK